MKAENMKRGEIWLVEVEGDRRLCLVLSSDAVLLQTTIVSVLPLTEEDRPLPTRVPVPASVMLSPHWVVTEGMRAVSRSRFIARAGAVPEATMATVSTCVKLLLDLS